MHMIQSASFAVRASISPRKQSSKILAPARASRMVCLAVALILALAASIVAPSAYGQATADPTSTQTVAQSQAGDLGGESAATSAESDDTQNGERSTGSAGLTSQTALSAEQIINILQETPDLVVELKSELADRLEQQGIQIDPTDISDQMLYSQISSNANLRASITSVLRARGYVSEDDLQSMGSSVPQETTPNLLSSASPSLLPGGDAAEAGLAASVGRGGGLPGFGGNSDSVNPAQSMRPDRIPRNAAENRRSQEKVNASTDSPSVLRRPAPYNLQSMRDLYAQIPTESARLKRFGSDVFTNRDVSAIANGISGLGTPLDVPLGPDYIVGPGDTLTVNHMGRSYSKYHSYRRP